VVWHGACVGATATFATFLCLVQLYLNFNNIGDAGATEVAKALVHNHTLTTVSYVPRSGSSGACRDTEWRVLHDENIISHLCGSLRSVQLRLDSNNIGAAGASELAKALAVDCALTEVCNASVQ